MPRRQANRRSDRRRPEGARQAGSDGAALAAPIAVIGIGCRFPGASSPDAFWRVLREGVDAIADGAGSRWDIDAFYDANPGTRGKIVSHSGGFLDRVDRFDPLFFGISPREAVSMDPQQRLLLEVAWEAMEDAGLVAGALARTRTGVFIGVSNFDYGRIPSDPDVSGVHLLTGSAGSVTANRISYVFDFQGPSVAVDTACSSALVAAHLACCSLWNGESTLAMVGGVNIILSPAVTVSFSQAGMLSPDGRCKTFDAAANGYVRSEGAGLVILKPLSQALEDGDPIHAVIRGSAINQDGHSGGLTVPSQRAQEAVIVEACRRAGISPGQIDYVEAHGTGTFVGDPIEARALGNALAIDRPPGRRCAVGSAKTNVGHLESAAGIVGLIKVVLSLKHRQIPPSLHFREANPHIPFDELPIRVQTSLGPWPSEPRPPLAGVNSFGFGGANAHVIVEGFERDPSGTEAAAAPGPSPAPEAPYVLPLSGHTPGAVRSLAHAYREFLAPGESAAGTSMRDICYTAAVRRTHHDHRLAVVGRSRAEVVERLAAGLDGGGLSGLFSGPRAVGRPPQLVFVFPGQGPQWWAMGRQLLERAPVFRAAIERCDELLRGHAAWSLMAELTADESGSRLGDTEIAQPVLFALQVALVALWRSWGVTPHAVVGHSVGEVAAAHVAGVLGLEDALRIVFHRGRLMQRATGLGKMAAVDLSWEDATRTVAGHAGRLSVAAHNSPTSTTLSGEAVALDAILESLQARQVFARLLPVNYAFHSFQMEPFLHEFAQTIGTLEARPATMPIFSTVTGRRASGPELDAAYWGRNLREPVLFSPAVDALLDEEYDTFLELSPHPTLVGPIAQSLRHRGKMGTVLSSLRRGEDEEAQMLGALGALYTSGYPIEWSMLYPAGGRTVQLPAYPWDRERYWFETGGRDAGDDAWQGGTKADHPLLGRRLGAAQPLWQVVLDTRYLPFLDDHRVQGSVVLPATAYVEMALAAAADAFGEAARVLLDVEFHEALLLPEGTARRIQIVVDPERNGGGAFRVYSRPARMAHARDPWTLHCSGKMRLDPAGSPPVGDATAVDAIRARCPGETAAKDLYARLDTMGLQYGARFQGLERLWIGEREALGELRVPPSLEAEVALYRAHPALLDACLHVFAAALPTEAGQAGRPGLYLPRRIGRVSAYDPPGVIHWSHARFRHRARLDPKTVEGDLRVLDADGRVLVEVCGLQAHEVQASAKSAEMGDDLAGTLFELRWEAKPRPEEGVEGMPVDYMPALARIAERLRGEVDRSTRALLPYEALWKRSAPLITAYIVLALQRLGVELRLHQRFSAAALAAQAEVAPRHRQYFERLVEKLVEGGVLRRTGSDLEVCQVPEIAEDVEQTQRVLMAEYPECEPELRLVGRSLKCLPEVLRGDRDPLEVLFPDGSFSDAEALYRDSLGSRTYNALAREAIGAALEGLPPGRKVRILELGAGTGGTSSYLLPALPPDRTEYVFADISSLFLANARQKFRDFPFVRYQLLDIERDPVAQGFPPHRFDVVVASLVLHATRSLRESLRHVQHLLAPEGLLVLLELSDLTELEVVFGMTEGWWRFRDVDLRPSHPLLSRSGWQHLLEETGFTEAVAVSHSEDAQEADWFRGFVMLARGPRVEPAAVAAERLPSRPARPGTWIVFADTGGVGHGLAEMLRANGERCVIVSSAGRYETKGPEHYEVDPDQPEHFRRLLRDAFGPGDRRRRVERAAAAVADDPRSPGRRGASRAGVSRPVSAVGAGEGHCAGARVASVHQCRPRRQSDRRRDPLVVPGDLAG